MKNLFVSLLVIFFSSLSFSQSTFVGLVLEEVDNGGLVPGTTYRLYAELSGGLVYSVVSELPEREIQAFFGMRSR